MSEKVVEVKVSDEFIEIYRKFNVVEQVEIIKKLKESNPNEFYLLLFLVLDKHSDDDKINIVNLTPFKDEVMEIYDMQDDKEVTNDVLKELAKITNDTYVDTNCLVDKNDEKLPEPYTKEEVRDLKISIITDENEN